jgi:threonine dehydrogenase-like Zn-dependent dehydrogenase
LRALRLYGIEDARVIQVPDPVLKEPTDAIVRVTRSGLCGTDVMFYREMPALYLGEHSCDPIPLGHEMVGVVEDVGTETTAVKPGDFVVVAGSISDGTCDFCREGNQNSCENGLFWGAVEGGAGGGHAELVRVPLADGTLVRVPDVGEDAPDELQASLLTTADVYSTGHHAIRAAGVRPAEAVIVIGDGAVGLMSVLAAREAGAGPIVLMGRHRGRTNLGVDFGASHVVAERGQGATERVLAIVGPHGAPRVIDAVGTLAARLQALEVVRPGGTVSQVGSPRYDDAPGQLALYQRNITLTGGSASVRSYMPGLIAAVLDGRVQPGRVFDRSLDLDQAPAGLELMRNREALKVMLRC